MITIKKAAFLVEYTLIVFGIPLIIGSFIASWIYRPDFLAHWCTQPNLPTMLTQILSMLVDSVSSALLVWGCIYVIRLARCYRKNELFSENTMHMYNKITTIALVWTIYNPIKHTLLTLLSTIHNPVGQRLLTLTISSDDIFHIIIIGLTLVMNSLMYHAYELKCDQDLTI